MSMKMHLFNVGWIPKLFKDSQFGVSEGKKYRYSYKKLKNILLFSNKKYSVDSSLNQVWINCKLCQVFSWQTLECKKMTQICTLS